MLQSGPATVGRLRVVDGARDGGAAATALARRLERLELGRGLPRGAILVVRRVADPGDPAARDDRAAEPGAGGLDARLDAALERAAREAARPAYGAVPAGAVAVLFADRAELLACAAEDWARGDGPARWWWAALSIGDGGPARAWLAEPRLLPVVVSRLAGRGSLPAVAGATPPAEAEAALGRLLAAFGIRPEATEDALATAGGASAWSAGGGPGTPTTSVPSRTGAAPLATRLWEAGVRPPPAPAPVATLLAAALAIDRAPGALGDVGFGAAIGLLAAEATGARPGGSAASRRPAGGPQLAPRSLAAGWGRPAVRSAAGHDVARDAASPATVAARRPDAPPTGAGRPTGGAPEAFATVIGDTAERVGPLVTDTRLGGLFHLLNLAVALGLCADFTRPLDGPAGPDPWVLVAGLGRRLGAGSPRDPVWALLDDLAAHDRRGMRRGARAPRTARRRWRAPATWRIPAAWLEPFPPGGVLAARVEDGRRVVRHPAGFVVLDEPLRTIARAAAGARRGGPAGGTRGHEPDPRPPAALDRWLDHVAGYAAVRLRLALGLGDHEDLARVLLRRAARVIVVDERIVVSMRLAELPIAVRIAGLDRDLGWVPAARRSVTYEFA